MKKYGIWIDSKAAWVAEVTETGLVETTIQSEAERKPRFPGEKSRKTTRASKGFDYESSQEAHFSEALKKYIRQTISVLQVPAEVLIFGPGEVKHHLEKACQEKRGIVVLAVKPHDKATLNQKRKFVRDFFTPVKVKTTRGKR